MEHGVGSGWAASALCRLIADAPDARCLALARVSVVWSQIGIIGYLLGPLAGGILADTLGYAFVGTVSGVAGLLVAGLMSTPRSPATRPPQPAGGGS